MSSRVQQPRLRADAARNRDQVLEAARAAVDDGDMSLMLNEIARRASVGVGTVYRHFPTPRHLLEAVVTDRLTALVGEAEDAATDSDPWNSLQRLTRATISHLLADAALAEVLGAANDADTQTTQLKYALATIADAILDRTRQDGHIRTDVDADDFRRLVCGIIYAARLGDGDPGPRADNYLSITLAGLRTTD
ncbi:TetR/AcrR family transcriptional regulator [Nocardia sp. NPDC020380]|uniref:TetR/AcrR family transcriptional regulator n=1 Tax=Nocardia sp. NPDC020380 TaxID=3364309 RepID=UPI0037A3E097